MKETELRKSAVCGLCQQKIGKASLPFFYRVTVESYGIDLDAVRQQQGLTDALGGSAVMAHIMGPDKDMAHRIDKPKTITVCATCYTDQTSVAAIACCQPEEAVSRR